MPNRSADSRKHILFINPRLADGGAERVLITLLRHLDRKRFRLTLAVLDTRDAVFLRDVPPDVTFVDLKCKRVRYAWGAILRLVWTLRPNVVFSTLNHLNIGLAATRFLWPRGTRLFVRPAVVIGDFLRTSDDASLSELFHSHVWYQLMRAFMTKADGFIFQSKQLQSDFCSTLGTNIRNGHVIHNPVDIDRLQILAAKTGEAHYAPGYFHLVAMGRLSRQKGFDTLLDAMALLKGEDVRLTILGKGHLYEELQDKVRAHGLTQTVLFEGFKANPYPYLRQADLFVLPSRYEGFPNVVLEALACGTPVIATALPGLTEILAGVPGCQCVPVGDAKGLAAAIRRRIKRNRVRVSPDTMRSFDVKTISRAYEAVFG